MGLDPLTLLENATMEEIQELAAARPSAPLELQGKIETGDMTYKDFVADELLRAGYKTQIPPHKISVNDWVACGNNIYVLDCMQKGFARIEKEGDGAIHI